MKQRTRDILIGIAARGDLDIERNGESSIYNGSSRDYSSDATGEYRLAKMLLAIEAGDEA
jgi:hypothetical protein